VTKLPWDIIYFTVAENDYYPDLLFYHTHTLYAMIELKNKKFKS